MDLRLTEILCCPRCGALQRLVLLADRVQEQRVYEGVLGCPGCGARYPVHGGLADLRTPEERTRVGADEVEELSGGGTVAATRIAALIGMEQELGARHALVVGPAVAAAPGMAALVPESEVVTAGPGVSDWQEAAGISRSRLGRALPFGSGTLRGVALTGPAADALLEEGVRVLDPMGRLLLEPAPAGTAERLAQVGARVVAREGETVVAVRVRVG